MFERLYLYTCLPSFDYINNHGTTKDNNVNDTGNDYR